MEIIIAQKSNRKKKNRVRRKWPGFAGAAHKMSWLIAAYKTITLITVNEE